MKNQEQKGEIIVNNQAEAENMVSAFEESKEGEELSAQDQAYFEDIAKKPEDQDDEAYEKLKVRQLNAGNGLVAAGAKDEEEVGQEGGRRGARQSGRF